MGIVLARSCGLSRVSQQAAKLIKGKEGNLRQRLREFFWEKEAKAGEQRQELEVGGCFADLLGWVLKLWSTDERRIALAMDASSLKQDFVALSISVVYRGNAIPVAWKILKAGTPGSWKEEWLKLFASLKGVIPADWCVLVLADRGLYADWLFHAICKLGWHPFLRINLGGKFRQAGSSQFLPLSHYVLKDGRAWADTGTCFKTHPIQATLLTCYDPQYEDPWLIVTDLAPHQACHAWYGLRSWIENGFRSLKRGAWNWHRTRMSDPARAARLWLALAVATLWSICVGSQDEDELPASGFDSLPPNHVARRNFKNRQQPRSLSCLLRGVQSILAAFLDHKPFPIGYLRPDPWPS